MPSFDIEHFLELSGAVRAEPEELDEIRRTGLTDPEKRILQYMGDTERHTILYMRDLLAGHSSSDPEITAFLSVWVYEELYHARALEQALEAAGTPPDPERYRVVSKSASIRETIEAVLSHAVVSATPRFIAVHMTWGAINELVAAAAYGVLAERTASKGLTSLLTRIAKQERKHFAFYYQQAAKRLQGEPRTQSLVNFAIKRFWTIVGSGVGGADNLGFVAATLFNDPAGIASLTRVEQTVRELPSLEWFDMLNKQVAARARNYEAQHGKAPTIEPRPQLRAVG